MLDEYKDVITIEQLKDILCVGRYTAYKLVKEGRIASKRIGGKFIIPKFAVIDFLKS